MVMVRPDCRTFISARYPRCTYNFDFKECSLDNTESYRHAQSHAHFERLCCRRDDQEHPLTPSHGDASAFAGLEGYAKYRRCDFSQHQKSLQSLMPILARLTPMSRP